MGAKDRNKYDHDDDVDVIGEDQSAIVDTVCINISGSTIPAFTGVLAKEIDAGSGLVSVRPVLQINTTQFMAFLGITLEEAINGAEVTVRTAGHLENLSASWPNVKGPIYVADNGVLTQTFDPAWSAYLIAGHAFTETRMLVIPQAPILNSLGDTTPNLPLVADTGANSVIEKGMIARALPAAMRTALSLYSVAEVAALVSPRVAKTAARLATTGQKTLSGLSAIDGVTPVAADRILVKDQTSPAQNGVYAAASGAWTRVTDMDTWAEAIGAEVAVTAGTVNAGTTWLSSAGATGTLGTTTFTWVLTTGVGTPQPESAVLDVLVANGAPGVFGLARLLDANLAAALVGLGITSGTWTPALALASPGDSSFAYANQTGQYVKMGRLVVLWFNLTFTPTIGTGTGNLDISGFGTTPGAASAAALAGGAVYNFNLRFTWPAGYSQVAPYLSSTTLAGGIFLGTGVNRVALGAAHMATGQQHIMNGVLAYFI